MSNKKGRFSKRKRSGTEWAVIVCLILLIALLAGLIGWILLKGGLSDATPHEETVPEVDETQMVTEGLADPTEMIPVEENLTSEPEETKITIYSQMPFLFEDGKLEIESIFQYTGLNPDAGWQDGVNTGAVVLTNRSDEYLETLNLEITLSDGTVLHYLICDIPAGKTVWAFDYENTAYAGDILLENVQYTASFRENSRITSDMITVSVDGMEIALTNVSGKDLHNLEMRCHSISGDVYFCGNSYTYQVDQIAAGETVVLIAEDCVFGDAEVAIIDYAN